MANDTMITVVGNVDRRPRAEVHRQRRRLVNFTIASTPRMFDKKQGEWKDGEALFLRCNAWRDFAENITETSPAAPESSPRAG